MARKRSVGDPEAVGKAGMGHGIKKAKKADDAKRKGSITKWLQGQAKDQENRKPLGEIDNVKVEKTPVKENIMKEEMKVEKPNIVKNMKAEDEDEEMEGLCEYERIRLRNIRQREALFAELAILEAKEEVSEKKEKVIRDTRRNKEEKAETEPIRKSLRLAGGKVPEIKRFSYEQFEYLDKELRSRKIRPEDFYLDDELVSRNTAVEEREKMLAEMAAKARTFSGATERPDGLKEVESGRFKILHVPKKCTIKQFVLSNSLQFKCGRGFYEFTKPEIISHKKEVVVVEKSSGSMFSGKDACRLIGAGGGMRIPPTIFETWQVFVQSTSYGRVLIGGTDFLYEA